MMLYRALLVLLVTLSGAVASEISLRGGEEDSSEVTSTNNRDLTGKPVGIPICKEKGKEKGRRVPLTPRVYKLTTLPHIYRVPGDSVPSMPGYVLNETCEAVPVSCPCFTAADFSDVVNTEDDAPKTCIKDAPEFVEIITYIEGGCSGYNDLAGPYSQGYNCGHPGVPGVPGKLSCDFRPDGGRFHVDDITEEENKACQAIIIKEMFNCVPPV
jgi:hypothetical protein